jgi:tetratricopeptide (TPR) repeat protein
MYAEDGVKLDEAIVLVKRALDISPNNGAYIDSLGWAYYRKGMIDEAEIELKKAIEIYGKDPVLYDHMGDVYYKKGLTDKAKEFWKKSLEIDPDQKGIKEKLEKAERTDK